jgi:hypothetical protein
MDINEIEEKILWKSVVIGDFLFISDLKVNYDNVTTDKDDLSLPSVEDFAPKEQIFAAIATKIAEENLVEIESFQFLGNSAVFLMC